MLTPINIYESTLPAIDECIYLRRIEGSQPDREDIVNVAVARYLEHLQERTARLVREAASQ